jgi:purine nucleosidase
MAIGQYAAFAEMSNNQSPFRHSFFLPACHESILPAYPDMAQKILLDTDIGSDIDDAVCLAYLLANPACDLLGITTVTGDTVKRASLASVLCKIAGKKIPIHPGRRHPLVIKETQSEVPQAVALKKWDHDTKFSQGEAVEFLRQTIRANPGEITLLAIGPMTNVAALFAADEEIPHLLKSLVLMCGVFSNKLPNQPANEWNAKLDPEATAVIYGAKTKVHRSIGLDVTLQVQIQAEEVRKKFQAPLLKPVADFAEFWFEHTPVMTFHDPLAATTIFDDTLCGFERGEVEVELKSTKLAGTTLWTPKADGPHEIATKVDAPKFFEHYFGFFK